MLLNLEHLQLQYYHSSKSAITVKVVQVLAACDAGLRTRLVAGVLSAYFTQTTSHCAL